MREIKFRAWDRRHNEMILIDDFYWFEENQVHSQDEACGTTGDFVLMQYTGLKDKNGVEIYEGDIVRAIDVISSVEWVNDGFWEIAAPGTAESTLLGNHIGVIEVIGNIYENPELLQ